MVKVSTSGDFGEGPRWDGDGDGDDGVLAGETSTARTIGVCGPVRGVLCASWAWAGLVKCESAVGCCVLSDVLCCAMLCFAGCWCCGLSDLMCYGLCAVLCCARSTSSAGLPYKRRGRSLGHVPHSTRMHTCKHALHTHDAIVCSHR